MQTFERMSRQSAEHLKQGMFMDYIHDLKQMADILNAEGRRIDELKVLMLEFHFVLNCTQTIDFALTERTKAAVAATGMTENEMEQLYLDTIRPDSTPHQIMGVRDSLYILKLCIAGREDEAREIVMKSGSEIQNIPNIAQRM